jgi:hypothetical protein
MDQIPPHRIDDAGEDRAQGLADCCIKIIRFEGFLRELDVIVGVME